MNDQELLNLKGYYINFPKLAQKLKEIAVEQKMTQSELAAGITPREHLNKILNGHRNPSLIVLYQMCDKLHVDINLLIEQCYYIDYEQTTHYIHEMKKCVTIGDYDQLEQLVEECTQFEDFHHGIAKQFSTYQKGIIQLKKYNHPVIALNYFEEALNASAILLEGQETLAHSLVTEEVSIQIDKAICLFQLSQEKEAIQLLSSLINHKVANDYRSIETYHILRAYFYLSKFYLLTKDYEMALVAATEGINLAHCKFIYIYAGDLHSIKGLALHHLENKRESVSNFNLAFKFYSLFEAQHQKELLNEHLIELGIIKRQEKSKTINKPEK
ncbi:MAG: helix-turn-helix transcriptional regulator [Turicibacter sp.]|nr:helix-turn-helix transcriptional regulator [Turicibacter sp.]